MELRAPLHTLSASTLMEKYEVRQSEVVPKHVETTQMRVALVAVYRVPCGIATYSEWLWEKIGSKVAQSHVFTAYDESLVDTEDMTQCWRPGGSLVELLTALKAYDPDVIFIQHEYGHFPDARRWLSFITALDEYPVLVTLHSVYQHKDKTICEAAIPHIVVHTHEAAAQLKETKQVRGSIDVIPHGCTPCTSRERFWNLYSSNHTIIQFGFGFAYKGWPNALSVVAELKKEYPDVFFTGLFSERWPNTHNNYYRELDDMIDTLKIRDHAALVRGFQSNPCLDSYLRTNRVALFPYIDNGEHTVYGCSGAARLAMSKGLPVVASKVPHFEDLEGICPRPNTIAGWAQAVADLFESPEQQLQRQDLFLEANSWENVSNMYLDLAQELIK